MYDLLLRYYTINILIVKEYINKKIVESSLLKNNMIIK